jgi:hypothetical protein
MNSAAGHSDGRTHHGKIGSKGHYFFLFCMRAWLTYPKIRCIFPLALANLESG